MQMNYHQVWSPEGGAGPSIEEGEAGPGQCLWVVPADKPVLGAGEA